MCFVIDMFQGERPAGEFRDRYRDTAEVPQMRRSRPSMLQEYHGHSTIEASWVLIRTQTVLRSHICVYYQHLISFDMIIFIAGKRAPASRDRWMWLYFGSMFLCVDWVILYVIHVYTFRWYLSFMNQGKDVELCLLMLLLEQYWSCYFISMCLYCNVDQSISLGWFLGKKFE